MSQREKSRNADFSGRLNALMESRAITRSDLARELDIAWSSVDRWFSGSVPHRATLERLAGHLGVSAHWLKTGEGEMGALNALAATVEAASNKVGIHGPRAMIRQAMFDQEVDFKELHRRTGYGVSPLKDAIEGRARASEAMLTKVAEALDLDKGTLMAGTEALIDRGPVRGTFGATPDIYAAPGVPRPRFVPLLSMAQAGTLVDASFTDEAYDGTGVVAIGIKDRAAFAVEIVGDSMPPYKEGDYAIACPSIPPRNGNMVLCRLKDEVGGETMFKLYSTKDSGKRVVLTSTNPLYQPVDYAREEFRWIYPVASVTQNFNLRNP